MLDIIGACYSSAVQGSESPIRSAVQGVGDPEVQLSGAVAFSCSGDF